MSARSYQFGEAGGKIKARTPDSKYVRELKSLVNKQKRWLTRIRRAVTAISKIERQIKRLDA